MSPALLLTALLQVAAAAPQSPGLLGPVQPGAAPPGAPPAVVKDNPSAAGQLSIAVSPACALDAARQFDFLLGRWSLSRSDDLREISRVEVRRAADGCALIETDTPTQGASTVSLSVYDPGATIWRRTQISGEGELLTLEGGEQNGAMVLEGEVSAPGKSGLVRLTWTRTGETVHETEESSTDGRVWSDVFSHDLHPLP
ncbi:MAG: hypothetical protein KGL69_06565 [Alphaproteobacteria bacterium]|jgi:hypothetical protein|nr:hypothetical protein [Alphaproteobacteria bacterium]